MNIEYFKTHEMLPEHDEDAPPVAQDDVLIICDGMGGTGLIKHKYNDKIRTSAYLGSRFTSNIAKEFISSHKEKLFSDNLDKTMIDFKHYIHKNLRNIVKKNGFIKSIKGRSVELLPTTMFATVFNKNPNDDTIDVLAIWAGDSRIYMLNQEYGMMQVSKDNIQIDNDALENMIDSSVISNNINAEEELNFELYYYKFTITSPTIIFACSDGVFDYANTPMQFERGFLNCIMSLDSKNSNNDFSLLGDIIGKYLQNSKLHDDCSLAGACIGFQNVSILKNSFKERLELVDNMCNTYLTNNSEYNKSMQKIIKLVNTPENKDIIEKNTENFKSITESIIKYECADEDIEILKSNQSFEKLKKFIYNNICNSQLVKLINDICDIKQHIREITSCQDKVRSKRANIEARYNDEFKRCFIAYKLKEIEKKDFGYTFGKNPIKNYKSLLDDYNKLMQDWNLLGNSLIEFLNSISTNDTDNLINLFIKISSNNMEIICNKYNNCIKLQNNRNDINNKLNKSKAEVKQYIIDKEYPNAVDNEYLSKSEFISAKKLKDEYNSLNEEISKLSQQKEAYTETIKQKREDFIQKNINSIIDSIVNSINSIDEIDFDISNDVKEVLIKYWQLFQNVENIENTSKSYYDNYMNVWYRYKTNYEFFKKYEIIYNTKKAVNV